MPQQQNGWLARLAARLHFTERRSLRAREIRTVSRDCTLHCRSGQADFPHAAPRCRKLPAAYPGINARYAPTGS